MAKEVFESYVEITWGECCQTKFRTRQFEKNYKKFFPIDRASAVLDVGIGRGEMLTCMKEWAYSNHLGIDISPSTVNFCKSIGLNCIQVEDTTEWLLKNKNKFDLITLLDVLEHIKKEDAIQFLRALNQAMKDNAILIIQVPNMQAPDAQLHRYNDFTHEIGFTENSLKQLLLVSGFKKFTFYGFDETFPRDVLGKSLKQFAMIILRRLYWKYVRFIRKVNGNLNPEILNPVLFAVVTKTT